MMMKMKGGLSGPFLLLLLLLLSSSTVSGLGSVVWKTYSYINIHSTWQEAQTHCRSSAAYSDLATISTQSDETLINMIYYHAWVGLHRDPNDALYWIWSDGSYSVSPAWARYEPGYSDDCATIYCSNKWFYGQDCSGYFFFYCKKSPNSFKFIPQSKSWSEAREYCSSQYVELANFKYFYHLSAVQEKNFPVWIGLFRDASAEGAWKWSRGLSEYRNWAPDEPGPNGDCVSISSTGKVMATQDCSDRFPFVCYKDNLVLVKENKTWEEALVHCQALTYKLVSVQPDDHAFVMTKVMEADTEEVWTGLRFLADDWLWINAATMMYDSDLPLCPPERQRCGALSKNNTGSVGVADCSEKRNFLCYTY